MTNPNIETLVIEEFVESIRETCFDIKSLLEQNDLSTNKSYQIQASPTRTNMQKKNAISLEVINTIINAMELYFENNANALITSYQINHTMAHVMNEQLGSTVYHDYDVNKELTKLRRQSKESDSAIQILGIKFEKAKYFIEQGQFKVPLYSKTIIFFKDIRAVRETLSQSYTLTEQNDYTEGMKMQRRNISSINYIIEMVTFRTQGLRQRPAYSENQNPITGSKVQCVQKFIELGLKPNIADKLTRDNLFGPVFQNDKGEYEPERVNSFVYLYNENFSFQADINRIIEDYTLTNQG